MNGIREQELTPSKLLHDVVSQASTILSISQMAVFSYDNMSDDMRQDFDRIMETAHEIVANIDKLGQLLEEAEE